MKKLLLWVWLAGVTGAETRLEQLLREQRQHYAGAVVTSGFYDARGISRYRSQPGLHSGYDIALPAGTRVRAAWPGTVRAIVPWAVGEWGVEVVHSDGTAATYGHIAPLVEVGRRVSAGESVGTVARDHVDVKMRDAQGVLFDYADALAWRDQGRPGALGPSVEALDWQRRWRALARLPLPRHNAQQLADLSRAGLSVCRNTAGAESLASLRRDWMRLKAAERAALGWDEADRQQALLWRERAEAAAQSYRLGLTARNQWSRLREMAELSDEVLGGTTRTGAPVRPTGGRT